MTLSRAQSISLAVVAALVLVIGGLVLVWDWSWFRGMVARSASDALGREVTVGDLSVDPGSTPRIVLRAIAVGNAPWGEAEDFARAEVGRTLGREEVVRCVCVSVVAGPLQKN